MKVKISRADGFVLILLKLELVGPKILIFGLIPCYCQEVWHHDEKV